MKGPHIKIFTVYTFLQYRHYIDIAKGTAVWINKDKRQNEKKSSILLLKWPYYA